MAKLELIMPKLGESIIEATILKWTKQVGDSIEQEETVLEIATDKVDSEVPSPVDGVLLEVKYQEGDVVPVGAVIAIIESESEVVQEVPSNGHPEESVTTLIDAVPFVPEKEWVKEGVAQEGVAVLRSTGGTGNRFYSPLVINIARKEGISMEELEQITGSGRSGRVTKKDILSYVKNRGTQSLSATPLAQVEIATPTAPTVEKIVSQSAAPIGGITPKKFVHKGQIEVLEMDRMRKMIAENMIYSTHVSAHVTSFVEADVTTLVHWRKRKKDEFLQKYGEKLTFTPLFIQAVVKALRDHPTINASVDGDRILLKKDIHIGIAVALPSDNLIVPVIRHADRMNLVGLTAAVNDLAHRARSNKLKPDELEGGTYTLSNVGTFGNVMGTPIIMQPQVAILAVGAIRKLPAVVESPEGDMIAIRQKMFLSHSYDHRVVDGALGGRFVRKVADYLEAWDADTPI